MLRHCLFYLLLISGSLVLSSCAMVEEQTESNIVTPAITEPAGWQAEQHKRRQLSVWEIRGRLGVQTGTNGGSMDIIWKQSNNDYSIRLIAPLGAGTHLIQGNDQFAEISFPDGSSKIVDNIDEVLASIIDIPLPASAIRDWVRGIPAASLPVDRISWNRQGLPEKINQSGWHVELQKYLGTTLLLPHAIYVSRDDNEDLDVRLALKQWLIDQ